MIITVKFSNLSIWKEKAWKNQGFNGIRTRDLRDTGAMLYQLSYEAIHWDAQLAQLTSLPMCSFIAHLIGRRTGIAEVTGSNPVEALIFSGFFLPFTLEDLLRWSFFTLIYHRSLHMNYFIYFTQILMWALLKANH